MWARLKRTFRRRAARTAFRRAYCRLPAQRRMRAAALIPLVALGFGLCLLSTPVVADMVADHRSKQTINQATSTYEPAENPQIRAALAQAAAYNAALAGENPLGKDVLPYNRQLEFGGNETNAWIEIPAASVNLPIYKNASESSLAAGVGHLEGTSLPVGGVPSNCVLTAHSGMPDARMFDGIRKLQPGDKVCVHTLGTPFAYEVTDTEVVWPHETAHLAIYQKGTDMLTLVTCTPYGVNDHRLLVHCRRTAYRPDDFPQAPPVQASPSNRSLPFAGAAIASAAVLAALLLKNRRSSNRWLRSVGGNRGRA